MSTALAPCPDTAPAPQFRALDLTGPLVVPEFLRELAACENDAQRDDAQTALVHLLHSVGEELREKSFRLGDAAIAWLALEEARDRPTDRGAALSDLARQAGLEYDLLSRCFNVARAFPYGEVRDRYPDQLWSWFVNITQRTALPGERWGEERQERIERFAEECAELGPTQARNRINERLGKGLAGQEEPQPRTVTEFYAGTFVGEEALRPQEAGASTAEDLAYDRLQRQIDELTARLDPERYARELSDYLWEQQEEFGSRQTLREGLVTWFSRKWGGAL